MSIVSETNPTSGNTEVIAVPTAEAPSGAAAADAACTGDASADAGKRQPSQLELKLQAAQKRHADAVVALEESIRQGHSGSEFRDKVVRAAKMVEISQQELSRPPPKASPEGPATCTICMIDEEEKLCDLYNSNGTKHPHPVCTDCYRSLGDQHLLFSSRRGWRDGATGEYLNCPACRMPCALTVDDAEGGQYYYDREQRQRAHEYEERIRAQQAAIEAQRAADLFVAAGREAAESNRRLQAEVRLRAEARHSLFVLLGRDETPPEGAVFDPLPTYDVRYRCRGGGRAVCFIPTTTRYYTQAEVRITRETACPMCRCLFVDTWDADGVAAVAERETVRVMDVYRQEAEKAAMTATLLADRARIHAEVDEIEDYFRAYLDADIAAAGDNRNARAEANRRFEIQYRSAMEEWNRLTRRNGTVGDRAAIMAKAKRKGRRSTLVDDGEPDDDLEPNCDWLHIAGGYGASSGGGGARSGGGGTR